MIQFLTDHWAEISAFATLAVQLIRSEWYSLNPAVKYNGIIQKHTMGQEALKVLKINLVPENDSKN